MFHFLTEGRAYAALEDGERVELNAGDIVILPGGDSHLLGNGPPKQPVDSFRTFAKNLADGLKAGAVRRRRRNHKVCLRLHGLRSATLRGVSCGAAADS